MESESSCEVIYEHCFLKLKPFIRSLRVDSKILLVGFSSEHSWPLGEVLPEVTITTMQKMGIIESTIHAAVKFHAPLGIGTVFSTYEPNKVEEGHKKVKESVLKATKNILSCTYAEERIVIND
ncbi:hypothetical protein Tco_1392228 [Tanacetum coccineum]